MDLIEELYSLLLRNLQSTADLLESLRKVVTTYTSKVSNDNAAPLLHTHIVLSIMYQKQLMHHE